MCAFSCSYSVCTGLCVCFCVVHMQFHISCNHSCVLFVILLVCVCLYSWLWLCVCVCSPACVCFGSLQLPLVSKVFHSEPDEIPPASTAAIRQRIMQSAPRANTFTHTQTQVDFTLCMCVCVCVCVVSNMAEELITHPQFPLLSWTASSLREKACGKDRNTKMDR